MRTVRLSYSHNEELKRELMHYGVKGMKWGVRKDRRGSGHRRSKPVPEGDAVAAVLVGMGMLTVGAAAAYVANAKPKRAASKSEMELKESLNGILPTLKSDGILKLSDVPRIKGKHSAEADLKAVNPNRASKSPLYTKNCGFASLAYEMRRRGYDVEAVGTTVFNTIESRRLFFKPGPSVKSAEPKAAKRVITNEALQWGEGSRGMVAVGWRGKPTGHAFSVEVRNGKVNFVDAQKNRADVSAYFGNARWVKYMRTDNCKLTNDVLSATRKRT